MRRNPKHTVPSLLRGTFVLGGAGLLNRLIGFGFQTYLIRLAGPEPVGLYRMVAPLYFSFLTVTSVGIPYAVAKRVAEAQGRGDPAAARRIVLLAAVLLCLSGAAGAGLFYVSADRIADLAFTDERVRTVIQWMAPGIWLVAVASALRGYFQGTHQVVPMALSQITEQVTRAGVSIGLALAWMDKGITAIATAMAAGMIAGEFVGLIFLGTTVLRQYVAHKRRLSVPGRLQRKLASLQAHAATDSQHMFQLAGPLVAGNLTFSLLTAVYMFAVPVGLQQSGLSPGEATAIFGQYIGIATPIVRLPAAMYAALALNVIPLISRGLARQSYAAVAHTIDRAIGLTIALAIPVFFLLTVMAVPIARNIFHVPDAAPIIAVSALGAPCLYLRQTTTAVLRGLGRPGGIIRNQNIGLAINIVLATLIARIPGWGIIGVTLIAALDYTIASALNLRAIVRHTGWSFDLKHYLVHPLAATATAAIVMLAVHGLLSPVTSAETGLIGTCLCGVAAYVAWLQRSGVIRRLGIHRGGP